MTRIRIHSFVKYAVPATTLLLALTLLPSSPATGQIYPGSELDAEQTNNRAAARHRQYVFGEVSEVLEKWRTAWRKDDVQELLKHYAPTASVLLPGSSRLIRGRTSLQGYFESLLPQVEEVVLSPSDLEASGLMGAVVGRYRIYGAASAGGAENGTIMTVFRRIDGKWRIRSQIFRPQPEDRSGTGS